MTDKTVNYTPEQTQQIVGLYMTGTSTEQIAEQFGKSVRSIVAKLSREGVYVPKTAAKGQARVTKADMILAMANHFGLNAEEFASFEKATNSALELLLAKLKA